VIGRAAEPALRRLLEALPPEERRVLQLQARAGFIETILRRLKEPDNTTLPLSLGGVLRALAILEQIDLPEAQEALQELARGPGQARVTREAKATLERVQGRRKAR
jgi:hypothetical protein